MGAPNSTAQAALAGQISRPAYLAWLDILGDPIRVTTYGSSLAITGTGDADLDGQTFSAAENAFMGVSPVQNKEGGGSQVTMTLSGLIGIDTDVLNQIGSRSNFQGRICRLWAMALDPVAGGILGNIWPYYTGYMTVPKLAGDATQQTIAMTVESWLSFMSQASQRSWLAQSQYDSGDHSAEASIAIANGTNDTNLKPTLTVATILNDPYRFL